MTTYNDLLELEAYADFPAEHRLRACIAAHLSGEDYDRRCVQLAAACGYTRPEIVKLWISFRTRVHLDKLPTISVFLGISLTVLMALWVAEYAPEEHAEEMFKAVSPLVTDDELKIIELARIIYAEQAEDAAEATMLPPV